MLCTKGRESALNVVNYAYPNNKPFAATRVANIAYTNMDDDIRTTTMIGYGILSVQIGQ